ncbi:MAG: hypothetical protein ABIO70_19035 [Pseudomonadota bacterium]
MILACSACGAREALGGSAAALLARAPSGRLRCPACGSGEVRLQQGRAARTAGERPTPPGATPLDRTPPLADLGERVPEQLACGWWGRELMLRAAGGITVIEGLDPLRRMVIQGAASARDMVSRDGVSWEPLDHIPELQPYLAVSRHLVHEAAPRGDGGLVEAANAADGWAGADDPTESVLRPGRSGEARRPHAAPDSSHGA